MPSATYLPLYEDHDGKTNKTSRRLSSSMFLSCLLGSLILNILLAMTLWTQPAKTPDAPNPQTLYSPAQDVIEYKNVKFHSGFGGDLPVYDRPPSPEVDAAWDGLYECEPSLQNIPDLLTSDFLTVALTKVPRYQASLIANKTWPILGETGQYMVALDVFHQLHCLNEMRKAMYPEYYPITGEGIHTPHMRHCISSLRQSIMCSADVTPIVWQWSEKSKAAKERSDVVHTCRNFDTIKEWARERFVPRQQNMSIYIEDDLDIATLY